MTERTEAILKQALELSSEERADLAYQLITSMDSEPDADVEAEWQQEIEKRVRETLDGTAEYEDWDTARAEIRRELGMKQP